MTTHHAAEYPTLPPELLARPVPSAEHRLMRAVLEDALDILLDPRQQDRRGRALRLETEHWLARDDRDWPFSFVNVCDALAIDPDRVRSRAAAARLREMRPAA